MTSFSPIVSAAAQGANSFCREHGLSVGGSAFAWVAVITANQVQFEYWLRVSSLFAALVASTFTVWGVVRKSRRELRG